MTIPVSLEPIIVSLAHYPCECEVLVTSQLSSHPAVASQSPGVTDTESEANIDKDKSSEIIRVLASCVLTIQTVKYSILNMCTFKEIDERNKIIVIFPRVWQAATIF